MKWNSTRGRAIATILTIAAISQTGCQSGWKMPSASIFPWSKKPSESTLAGSNPKLSVPTQSSTATANPNVTTPTSPATRSNPTLLSSTNTRQSPYGSTGATTPGNAGFGSPVANRGLVANANGYQTGPYSTGNSAAPTGFTAPTGYANSVPPQQGGLPTGLASNGAAPSFGAPSFGAPGLPPAGLPTPGLPSPGVVPPTGLAANAGFAPTNPQFAPPGPGYAPTGSVSAIPTGMSSTNMASLPPAGPQGAMPNSVQSGFGSSQPNMNAPSYAGAAPYRPGSTGRPTAYDFSKPNVAPAGTNVPHTATGLPMPGQPNMYR